MTTRRKQVASDLEDLEEDEIPEVDPKATYVKGSIAKDIIPRLQFIIGIYVEDAEKVKKIQGFLSWVPPERLEEYLVLALDYAFKKVSPKARGQKRGVVGAGRRGG